MHISIVCGIIVSLLSSSVDTAARPAVQTSQQEAAPQRAGAKPQPAKCNDMDAAVLQIALEDLAKRLATKKAKTKEYVLVVDHLSRVHSPGEKRQLQNPMVGNPPRLRSQEEIDLLLRGQDPVDLTRLGTSSHIVVTDISLFLPAFDAQEVVEAARKKYPTTVSVANTWLPGYSTKRDRAVVRISFAGGSHGASAYYTLRLIKDRWSIVTCDLFYGV